MQKQLNFKLMAKWNNIMTCKLNGAYQSPLAQIIKVLENPQ